ncbi:MAG: DUF4278 domain-containing protein [Synechococcales bacterium]|nr:DUF4278 domain-containing protein [Synechococcales bacterium]
MKLTYRGTSYEYTPPTVEYDTAVDTGKYRGVDIRFRNPKKAPVFQPTLDLVYRNVAYQSLENAVAPAAPVTQPEPVAVTAASVLPVVSLEDKARSLLMGHHRAIKSRQQGMLGRLAGEVGLTASAATNYWGHIQGKVHPTFRTNYDRSRAALS